MAGLGCDRSADGAPSQVRDGERTVCRFTHDDRPEVGARGGDRHGGRSGRRGGVDPGDGERRRRGERAEIGGDIGSICPGMTVGAPGRQMVVAAGEVSETHVGERRGEEVVGRITRRRPAWEHVAGDHGAGEVRGQGTHRVGGRPVPAHPVLVVGGDGIREDKSGMGPAAGIVHLGIERPLGLEGGVVVDDDVCRPIGQEEQQPHVAAVCGEGADVGEQVVLDEHPLELSAGGREIVPPQEVDAPRRVPDDVVCERNILNRGPRRGAVLVPRGEHDGQPSLVGLLPVILEDVAVDQHPACVLQFEQVLDAPGGAGVRGVPDPPRQRLGEVVAADLDVGGHQVRDRRILPAEHDVLPARLQVVVHDLEGPRAVRAHDRLGIPIRELEVRQVRVDHGCGRRVHENAADASPGRVAVDVAPVEDDVVRDRRRVRLARAQLDQAVEADHRAGDGSDLDPDEAEVMRAGHRHDRAMVGDGIRPDHDLRHLRRVRGVDAVARKRQSAVGRAAPHVDPPGPRLVGKHKRARERRAGRQRDDVARVRAVERRLKVTAGRHGDDLPRRGRVGRGEEHLGLRRQDGLRLSGGPSRKQRTDRRSRSNQHGPGDTVAMMSAHDNPQARVSVRLGGRPGLRPSVKDR